MSTLLASSAASFAILTASSTLASAFFALVAASLAFFSASVAFSTVRLALISAMSAWNADSVAFFLVSLDSRCTSPRFGRPMALFAAPSALSFASRTLASARAASRMASVAFFTASSAYPAASFAYVAIRFASAAAAMAPVAASSAFFDGSATVAICDCASVRRPPSAVVLEGLSVVFGDTAAFSVEPAPAAVTHRDVQQKAMDTTNSTWRNIIVFLLPW
ncbi:hypothetical protein DQ04_03461070 [Trypanosoma grayi]|uniref:hypothetical protein n=1 Tax=Trypanosoma grayi TaxID=71804 RepID=UPI0004F490C2|nr:hypothetical protein DQ04_03461070 [Trypanosoma grayi]KEG10656.1 hypothetical protein DQ04_03461070 [Trypanosoma grayi]